MAHRFKVTAVREESSASSPPPGAAVGGRHLGGGVLASTVAQVATIVISAITSILIARILGAAGLGAFAVAASFFGIALLIAGLGVRQAMLVLVGSGRWPVRTVAADLSLPLAALGILGGAAMVGAYALLDDSALRAVPSDALPALAGALVFGLAWQWGHGFALATERYEVYALVFVAPVAAMLVLSVGLAAVSGVEAAILGLAAAHAVAGVLGIACAIRAGSRWRWREAAGDRMQRLREVFAFGLKSWGAEVLRYSNTRLDIFFVAAYTAAADVGKYTVAVAVTGIGVILPAALSSAIIGRTATLRGAAERGEISMDDTDLSDARACRHAVLSIPIAGLVVAVLIFAGIPIFYGAEFDRSITLALILLPGVLLLGLGQVMTSIVQGRGRPDYVLYAIALTAVPTFAGYVIVIPEEGTTGAAVVSLCSYAAGALIAYWFFRRTTGIAASRALVPRGEDVRAYRDVAVLTRQYVRDVVLRRRG
jgi:O-antigen/teichoic acid export membrane protein